MRGPAAPDNDRNVHALFVLGLAPIGAVQRNGLAGVARHRDPDEIAIADDAVGGIELYPAGARQNTWHHAWVAPPPRWLVLESRLGHVE